MPTSLNGTAQQRATTTVYDAANNLLSETTGQSTTSSYAHASTTSYAYDALSRVVQTILGYGSSAQSSSTVAYDAGGNVVSSTDGVGDVTSYSYDPLSRLVAEVAAYGTSVAVTATMLYDAAGNLLSETTGQSTTLAYANPATTSYAYDALDRVVETIQGYGTSIQQTSTVAYDAGNNVVSSTDAKGTVTSMAYDPLGRLVQTTAAVGVSGVQQTTSSVYDAAGNLVVSYDALGNATSYGYDALNRPVTVQTPSGGVITTTYDAGNNVLTQTDPVGDTTSYGYDALGRQITITDPNAGVTTSAYDAAGNQVSLTDADNNTTTMVYDSLNRLVQQINPLGYSSTYVYDGDGNLTSTTDADGRVRNISYDALNRETGETWVVSGSTVNTLTYTYDAANNLVTAGDQNSTYTMGYDALGRMTSEQEPFGMALTMGYDANNNRTLVQDSLGGTTTYVYDPLNRLTSLQFGGTGQTTVRIDQTYTARDQVATQTRYTDLAGTNVVGTSSYLYDPQGRLTSLQQTYANGSVLASYAYSYDNADRLTSKTDNGTTTSYSYNKNSELTQAGSTSYSYDATGNRTMSGYQTGSGNELLNDGTWTYTYDNEGNLIEKSQGPSGLTWYYTYDLRNRMTSAVEQSSPGGTTLTAATYVYDVFNNLIEEDVWTQSSGSTTVTRYAYDGTNAWAQLTGTNSLEDRRLFLAGANQVAARIDSSGTAVWYLADNQGSISDLVNYTGTTVLNQIVYDPYGNIVSQSNLSSADPYGFTGLRLDAATGLLNAQNRWYNPATGLWETQDPSGFAAGSVNLAEYVGNDPTNYVDPTGLIPVPPPPGRVMNEADRAAMWAAEDLYNSMMAEAPSTDSADEDLAQGRWLPGGLGDWFKAPVYYLSFGYYTGTGDLEREGRILDATRQAFVAENQYQNPEATVRNFGNGIEEIANTDLNRWTMRGPTELGSPGTHWGTSYYVAGNQAAAVVREMIRAVGESVFKEVVTNVLMGQVPRFIEFVQSVKGWKAITEGDKVVKVVTAEGKAITKAELEAAANEFRQSTCFVAGTPVVTEEDEDLIPQMVELTSPIEPPSGEYPDPAPGLPATVTLTLPTSGGSKREEGGLGGYPGPSLLAKAAAFIAALLGWHSLRPGKRGRGGVRKRSPDEACPVDGAADGPVVST